MCGAEEELSLRDHAFQDSNGADDGCDGDPGDFAYFAGGDVVAVLVGHGLVVAAADQMPPRVPGGVGLGGRAGQHVSPGRHRRGSTLDAHHAYLSRRIAETRGRIPLTALHRELAERGWQGSYSTLRDWARHRLDQPRRTPQPPPAPPSVRKATGWLTHRPSSLTEDEHQQLKAILDICPELATAHDLVRDFGDMITPADRHPAPAWIDETLAAELPGLSGFARGLNNDLDAVTAGLTLRWSSGGTEGAVNRIKKIKRQLYGRAEFELLRKMILLA
ncbi:ISL3 family transposase [Streptomyces sp. SD15]